MSIKLIEAERLLRYQVGANWVGSPQELDLALYNGMQFCVSEAARLRSQRFVYPLYMDLAQDVKEYTLPVTAYSVKGVERLDLNSRGMLVGGTTPIPTPLSPLSFSQRAHPDEEGFSAPYNFNDFLGYWVTHRTLHISPAPATSKSASLKVWAYCVPPWPEASEDEVEINPWVVRFWIAKSAELCLPPPDSDGLDTIERALKASEPAFNRWLMDTVTDVGPSIAINGSFV